MSAFSWMKSRARLDDVAHQRREDLVRFVGVVDLDLQQRTRLRVERGLPELVGIHLAEALVALDRDAFAAGFHARRQNSSVGEATVVSLSLAMTKRPGFA